MLMPMAAKGIKPGEVMFVLSFAATAVVTVASTFGGGGVEVCNIVALLGEN